MCIRDSLDIISQKNILETENHRILVEDTDEGEVLRERVHDLKQLVACLLYTSAGFADRAGRVCQFRSVPCGGAG